MGDDTKNDDWLDGYIAAMDEVFDRLKERGNGSNVREFLAGVLGLSPEARRKYGLG